MTDPRIPEPLHRHPLASRVLEVALALLPGAVVSVDGDDVGVGTTAGYTGLAFVITAFPDYVRLGLHGGAELSDPEGLLEGRGKVHRHVKLRTDHDLDRPALRDLMAATAARMRS